MRCNETLHRLLNTTDVILVLRVLIPVFVCDLLTLFTTICLVSVLTKDWRQMKCVRAGEKELIF